MMRFTLICLAAFNLLSYSPALRSQAQPAPSSQVKKGKVASIQFKGNRSYPSRQIFERSGLHVGDLVSKEDLQAAADRLLQLGLFSSVTYSFKSRGEDLDLTFEITEAPAVAVSFDNIPWYADAELIDMLRTAVPLFSGRVPQQGLMLDEIASALQKHLAQRGLQLSVGHDLINDPVGDEMVQQFHVEGAGLRIDRIDLGHPLAAGSLNVQAQLSNLVGKPYSRFAINLFLSEHVRPIYLERGHLRVRFGTPEVRFTGNPAKPAESLHVVVPIDPGPVYRWNGAHWSGTRALTADSLNALLALRLNEIADGNSIHAAFTRVEVEYGRRGYLDAKLTPKAQFDDAKALVSYDVAVSEAAQYHMGELVITGLSVAAERKLRAAWQIPSGAIFDRTQYDALLLKLQKPSPEVFGEIPLHYDEAGHWLRTHPENATVDVLLDFK
jgi:outer membrane protein assembly factor BamA